MIEVTDQQCLDEMEASKVYPFWSGGQWIYIIPVSDRSTKIAFRATGPTVRHVLQAAIRWRIEQLDVP